MLDMKNTALWGPQRISQSSCHSVVSYLLLLCLLPTSRPVQIYIVDTCARLPLELPALSNKTE